MIGMRLHDVAMVAAPGERMRAGGADPARAEELLAAAGSRMRMRGAATVATAGEQVRALAVIGARA